MFVKEILETSKGNEIVDKDGTIQGRLYVFEMNNKKYVLKYYFDYENREGEILQSLDHPFIPKCYEWGYYENRQYVIMDYVEGVTLEAVKHLTEEQKRLLKGLVNYLQAMGVAHHDIRPKHIIIGKDNFYLVDFGAAESREFPTKLRPEVLKMNEKYSPNDTIAVELIIKEFT